MQTQRSWTVLLIGGASGVGKTSISYRLAHHYGVGLTEVDDFQVVLEHMTTSEQYPVLHYWRTHFDEAMRMDDAQKLDYTLRYATVMGHALERVIANHLESHTPLVLDGDFILPALAVQPNYGEMAAHGQVQAIFVYEADEAQIGANYRVREGQDQPGRARTSWHYSEWLRHEAERLRVPTLAARPWATVFERAVALLDART